MDFYVVEFLDDWISKDLAVLELLATSNLIKELLTAGAASSRASTKEGRRLRFSFVIVSQADPLTRRESATPQELDELLFRHRSNISNGGTFAAFPAMDVLYQNTNLERDPPPYLLLASIRSHNKLRKRVLDHELARIEKGRFSLSYCVAMVGASTVQRGT
ncbi:hypothetical protein BU26DRAFT_511304 [Trematosphaeria pertusa]|uniref:Uncharacterized protein n=1 Tax=Trematosphaeria pertusa TaxID=390896 RepID=A0A6A6HUB0_9PLEO|nr:uncharacterized protein BU26DRAFT_511304 [Trematosphaeria pertusa]KAF2241509.1 hypothetical protein BU26DRAFT_511304 [Trematosphaeria pertusa]